MSYKTRFLDKVSAVEMEIRYRLSGRKISELDSPIFIVGCGHSGTTLLLKILGAHSRIHAIHFESKLAYRRDEAIALSQVFGKMCINAGKYRWVEKTPKHIRHIGYLLDTFPQAKIIVMIRDGRDVAYSLKRRGGTFKAAVKRWVNDNGDAMPFLEKENVYTCRYEDIVEDFSGTISELMVFLGETYEKGQEIFHRYTLHFQEPYLKAKWTAKIFGKEKSKKVHKVRRTEQIHSPLYDARGIYKDNLDAGEISYLKQNAGSYLRNFGYAKDGNG